MEVLLPGPSHNVQIENRVIEFLIKKSNKTVGLQSTINVHVCLLVPSTLHRLYSGTSLRRTPLGPTKIFHYREGVLWSGVYYTLCGLYLGFSKCLLQLEG